MKNKLQYDKPQVQSIELEVYSEPDENHRVKKLGMATAQSVFNQLNTHLESKGMLPDEYFIFNENLNEFIPENVIDFICHTNFGSSEGIYIDIFLRTDKGKQISFATGKTLAEDADNFIVMSRIAAECSLMLNGWGRKYQMNNDEGYKLLSHNDVKFIIIEKQNDVAILKRVVPPGYIVVTGLRLENDSISWQCGNYCSRLDKAAKNYNDICQRMNNFDLENCDDYER